jgi:hypothetical protein
MRRAVGFVAGVWVCVFSWGLARGATTVFFEPCQTYTLVDSGVTSDTISSNGYLFTYTRDKLFTGGTGQPIGRAVRVAWPDGVEAQAVTTPPPGVTDHKARLTLQRVDAQPFDFPEFTFKLLANTFGAGGSIEIMPLVDGEDAFDDPLYFDATGFYGQTFHYDTSPNPWGSTALLVGFDTYKIGLYVDFAFIALTLESAAPGPQSCCLPADPCVDLTAASCLAQGGTPLGVGTSCSCDACAGPPAPPPVPDGKFATTPMVATRLDVAGNSLQVTWDAISCPANQVNLLHGDLGLVAGYSVSGAACSLGTSGGFVWNGVPPGDSWFLIVTTDGSGTESSWGLDSVGHERNGSVPSGTCGATAKDPSGTCP